MFNVRRGIGARARASVFQIIFDSTARKLGTVSSHLEPASTTTAFTSI